MEFIFLICLFENQRAEIKQIHPEQHSTSNNSMQLIKCTIAISVNEITFYIHSKQTWLQTEFFISPIQEIGDINRVQKTVYVID